MKALVLFGHPNPQSFNGAILGVVKDELQKLGAEVKAKDLYQMRFNPLLTVEDLKGLHSGSTPEDIKKEQVDVAWADVIIMISPVWWYSITSMLRGYIDRVFSHGFAYRYTATGVDGLLKGKKGILVTTSGANKKTDQQYHMTDKIRSIFIDGFFSFCGITDADYINLYDVVGVSDPERKKMLEDLGGFIRDKLK